jgi:spermidine synthase
VKLRPSPAALAVLAALTAVLALSYMRGMLAPSRVVFEAESAFGRIRVVEARDGMRSLYTGEGRARQSALYPGRPRELLSAYTRVAVIGLALAPPDAHILFVGLGGGAMPMYARQLLPDARIDVVEIDPAIIVVAGAWFGFEADAQLVVHAGDGRAFIEAAAAGTWDVVVLDAYSDDEVPYSLTTQEFLLAVRSSLAASGVVVSNLWTRNPLYPSMLATYDAVFDDVRLLDVPQRAQRILVAGDGTRPLDRAALVAGARGLAQREAVGFDLAALVESGYELPAVPPGTTVLRDRR